MDKVKSMGPKTNFTPFFISKDLKMKQTVIGKIIKNHFIAMIICCAIPLIAISALSFMGMLGSWGLYAIFVLCPLIHILIMRQLMRSSDDGEDSNHS